MNHLVLIKCRSLFYLQVNIDLGQLTYTTIPCGWCIDCPAWRHLPTENQWWNYYSLFQSSTGIVYHHQPWPSQNISTLSTLYSSRKSTRMYMRVCVCVWWFLYVFHFECGNKLNHICYTCVCWGSDWPQAHTNASIVYAHQYWHRFRRHGLSFSVHQPKKKKKPLRFAQPDH